MIVLLLSAVMFCADAPDIVLTFEHDDAHGPFADALRGDGAQDAGWTYEGAPRLERTRPLFGAASLDLTASGPLELLPPCDLGEGLTIAAHVRDVVAGIHSLVSSWPARTALFVCFDPSGEYRGERLFLRFHARLQAANGERELKLDVPARAELTGRDWRATHHLAVTFARGKVTAFLDGEQIGTITSNDPSVQRLDLGRSESSLLFGASPIGDPFLFRGVCDDVVLLGRALAPAEIERLARLGALGAGLVATDQVAHAIAERPRLLSANEVAARVAPDAVRAADANAEWTLEQARQCWQPMTRAVQHVGVPGFEFQTGVMWDGSLVFGPFFRPAAEVARLGNNLLHLVFTLRSAPASAAHGNDERTSTVVRRGLVDGRLPIPWLQCSDQDLEWNETVFAHLLGRTIDQGVSPDENDVLVTHVRLRVHNAGATARLATLLVEPRDTSDLALGYKCQSIPARAKLLPVTLRPDAAMFCMQQDGRVRLIVRSPPQGSVVVSPTGSSGPDGSASTGDVFSWRVPLAPGETATIDLSIPYGLVDRTIAARIAAVDLDAEYDRVCAYWRALVDRQGTIHTPDPFVDDYLAAVAGQMCQQVAYRHTPAPGIWMYKTSPNHYEMFWPCNAAKALPVLDFRGFRELGERCLGSFVAMQTDDVGGLARADTGHGPVIAGEGFAAVPGFLGNFREWTANPLLISHGLAMWALAMHFRVTRDRAWLGDERAGTPLQAMLTAFDWVAAQRRRTMREAEGHRAANFGLLPAASAHDWLAGSTIFNDAFVIFGMAEVVRLLHEIGHARAAECTAELGDYRRCLRDDYTAAMEQARPVPLGDGTALPYAPRLMGEANWARPDWTYTGYGPLRAGAWGALDPFDPLVDAGLAFLEVGLPRGAPSFLPVSGPELADANFADVSDPRAPRHHLWRHYVEYETMWPIGGPLFLARDDLPRFFEWLAHNLAVVLHREWRVGVESLDGVRLCTRGRRALAADPRPHS
ncbi:MAG: LamG-like jellyroll fold domain-containing protein [Planctomycetota bacterium]